MAIQKTLWRPDTCDCEIIYEWDDSLASELRVHTISSIPKKCSFHQALDGEPHYVAVSEENQTKNIVLGHVLETYSALVDDKGAGIKELKPGIEYIWSFDVDRKLQAEFKSVDKPTAEAIQSSLDAELGSGKVEVKIP